MIVKTKQQMYDGIINASHWHQQPCPLDDDFNIITIRIPNKNVKIQEEFNGFDAFKKILNFCNKLPLHMMNLHLDVKNKNNDVISTLNKMLLDRLKYIDDKK